MTESNNIHFLYPAALFASKEPKFINTILGSCVAICIWDPILKIGGMNHYMLPFWNGQGLASPKYGNIAIEKLIQKMVQFGSNPRNLVAKVFGGGEVIDVKHNSFNIGIRNIEVAFNSLKEYNIPIKAQSVGGKNGRKIQFNTLTGEVKMKIISRSEKILANSNVGKTVQKP
jgi:chemotaxis protein CheD